MLQLLRTYTPVTYAVLTAMGMLNAFRCDGNFMVRATPALLQTAWWFPTFVTYCMEAGLPPAVSDDLHHEDAHIPMTRLVQTQGLHSRSPNATEEKRQERKVDTILKHIQAGRMQQLTGPYPEVLARREKKKAEGKTK